MLRGIGRLALASPGADIMSSTISVATQRKTSMPISFRSAVMAIEGEAFDAGMTEVLIKSRSAAVQ